MQRSVQLESRLVAGRTELARLLTAREASFEALKRQVLIVENWLAEQKDLQNSFEWSTLEAARVPWDSEVDVPPVRSSLFWTQAHELAWGKLSALRELLMPYVELCVCCRDKSLELARLQAAWHALRRLEDLDES